jgi:hypothetical protein
VRILQHTTGITAIQRRGSNIFIGDTAGNITFLYFFQILENTPFEEWTVEEVAELMTAIGSPNAAAAILECRVDGKTLMAPNVLPLLSADFTDGGLNLNTEQRKWLLTEINKRRKDTIHTPYPPSNPVPSTEDNGTENSDNARFPIVAHPTGQQLFLKDGNGTRVLLASLAAPIGDIAAAIAHQKGMTPSAFAENCFLLYGSKVLENDRTPYSYDMEEDSTIILMTRTRGGGPKLPPQSNFLKVFAETAKKHATETESKRREQADLISGKDTAMQAASIEARRTLLLQEGALTEQSRQHRLDNDETRQIQEKAIREEVEVILASKRQLTQDEVRAFAQGVNKTVTTIKSHFEVPAEHKQKDFIQWLMTTNLHRDSTGATFTKSTSSTRLMKAGARDTVSAILRTRAENHTGPAKGQGCPSNESIRDHFQDIASKITVLPLPMDYSDKSITQSADFQIILVDAKHDLTEWVQEDYITIQGWKFDLIVEPPQSRRILLTPINQVDNRAKLHTLIESIKNSHTKGNIDTRFENILHQGILQSWNTANRRYSPNLVAVRVEYQRTTFTAKGGQNKRIKPSLRLLGERGLQPPPQLFAHIALSSDQEEAELTIQEILSAKIILKMNMIAETDKTPSNFISFSLNPLSKRPATGQEVAIDRARYHLHVDTQARTDCIHKLTDIVAAMEHDKADYTPEEGRTIMLSMSTDLMTPGRSHTSQRLGQSIVDTLGTTEEPKISSLGDVDTWREINEQANYVMARVTGINNLKTFFVADKFKNTTASRKDRDTTQMHLLTIALQKRGTRVEVLERIFDERTTGPHQDAFLAIFTEESWQHLQGSMVQITGSINWRLKSEAGCSIQTFDNKQQLIPDLVLRPLEDALHEEGEEDTCIIDTLKKGIIIFAPLKNKSDVVLSRLTQYMDIPELPAECKSTMITKIPNIKHPESALKTLYTLLDKDQARQIEGPQNTTLWIYAPFLDTLLTIDAKILSALRPTNSTEINQSIIMDFLYKKIKTAILQNAAQGLWMEDVPSPNTPKGTGSLDEGKDPFPTQEPVSMPMAIIPMLKLSKKIGHGLSTITHKVLSDLIDASILEPIEKLGHTMLLKKDSDLKHLLLQSDDLRVGFPFPPTLTIPQEDISRAFDQMLSTHFEPKGWGIVFLSTSEEVDYDDIETNDYRPILYSSDPLHICNAGSQILAQGTWMTQSSALKTHKRAKSIIQFKLQNPKGLLWLCPGKQNSISGTEIRTMDQLFGQGHGIDATFFNGGVQTTHGIWVELQKRRDAAILEATRNMVVRTPAIIPNRIFDTAVGGRPTTKEMQLKDSKTIHQGWLLLPSLPIDTNPAELLQTVLQAKDTETKRADGVVAILIEDMGILLARSDLFEKVRLKDVKTDLMTALTCLPTANNLKFLDGEKDEMDIGDNDESEAGVSARLPPDR